MKSVDMNHKEQYKEVVLRGMQPLLPASENIPIHRYIFMF